MNQAIDLCKNFGRTVTIRGLDEIVSRKSIFFRTIWALVIVFSVSILARQISTMFVKYHKYPYKTIEKENWALDNFPEITLCNLQPKLSVIDYELFLTQEEYKSKIDSLMSSIQSDIWKKSAFSDSSKKSFVPLRETYFNSLSRHDSASNVSAPLITHQRFIDRVQSRINDINCVLHNRTIWNARYRVCNRFRINPNCKKVVKSAIMVVFTRTIGESQQEHFDLYGHLLNGVSLSLGRTGLTEDPFERIILGSGTESTINVLRAVRTRLDKPYNREGCAGNIFMNNSGSSYTRFTCIAACIQLRLSKECNCYSRYTFIPTYLESLRLCGNTSLTYRRSSLNRSDEYLNILRALKELDCMERVLTEKLLRLCEVSCKEPCNYTYFAIRVQTVGRWPYFPYHGALFRKYVEPLMATDRNLSDYFADYKSMINKFDNKTITREELNSFFKRSDKIKGNFLKITIIFDNDRIALDTDIPEYSWESMVSMVGGCFSFWLGITVLTGVELIEFILRVIAVFKDSIFRKNLKSSLGNNLRLDKTSVSQ